MSESSAAQAGVRLGLRDGLSSFARGVGFVFTTPSIWGYCLVPVGMLLVLGCGLGIGGFIGSYKLSLELIGEPQTTGTTVQLWGLRILLGLFSLIVAAIIALALAKPLSGMALDAISKAQEHALRPHSSTELDTPISTVQSMCVSLVTLAIGFIILGTLFVANLLLPFLAIVIVPLEFMVCSWLLAWDMLDYPLSRHGLGIGSRLRWGWRNKSAMIAFGGAWSCFLVFPGAMLLILPMGTAGATRLAVRTRNAIAAPLPAP